MTQPQTPQELESLRRLVGALGRLPKNPGSALLGQYADALGAVSKAIGKVEDGEYQRYAEARRNIVGNNGGQPGHDEAAQGVADPGQAERFRIRYELEQIQKRIRERQRQQQRPE